MGFVLIRGDNVEGAAYNTAPWQNNKAPKPAPTMPRSVYSNLTSHIAVAPADDHPPAANVELTHVPFEKALTVPRAGLTMYYGKAQIPDLMQRRFQEADAAKLNLYEVRMRYDITRMAPMAVRVEDFPRTIVLNLPRISQDTAGTLLEMIRPAVEELDKEGRNGHSLHELVQQWPHLLDHMAESPELSNVACIIWNGRTPGFQNIKLATIYDPDRIESVLTIGDTFMEAVPPKWLYDAWNARHSPEAAVSEAPAPR